MIARGTLGEKQYQFSRNGRPAVGFAETSMPPAAPPPSTWTVALVTSVVGAAAGWVIEEVASNVRGRKKRR